MPNMAAITVKKNDGTTDIVYTNIQASAGDKIPAVWRSNSVGVSPGTRPEFRLSSQSNGPKTARRLDGTFQYPATAVGSDGKTNVVDRGILNISGVIPQGMTDADINELCAQGLNLFASALIKQSFQAGYAPT